MLVLVASTGRAVECACDEETRVEHLAISLARDVGVPSEDQLLIFDGKRLDPARKLGAYGLPASANVSLERAREATRETRGDGDETAATTAEAQRADEPSTSKERTLVRTPKPLFVFLYCKSALRPDDDAGSEERYSQTDEEDVIEIEPTPPLPRSDGSHPLETAAVRFFVRGGDRGASPTNELDELDKLDKLEIDDVSVMLHRLPSLERSFLQHRHRANARWRASRERFERCQKLVSEMHVQALAVDAALDTVETHFRVLLKTHASFTRSQHEQLAAHAEILRTFEQDVETLAKTNLHPSAAAGLADAERLSASASREAQASASAQAQAQAQAQASAHAQASASASASAEASAALGTETIERIEKKTLLDCLPEREIRRWKSECQRWHDNLAGKIRDLDVRFEIVKRETETLFMAGPDVDVNALDFELETASRKLDVAAESVRVANEDSETVRALVAHCVAKIGEDPSSGSFFSGIENPLSAAEAFAAIEAAEKNRVAEESRRSVQDDALAGFHALCAFRKKTMTRNVRTTLRMISRVQNSIREIKNAHGAFEEVASRQKNAFRELSVARGLPGVYAACLAESERRTAYGNLQASRARLVANLFEDAWKEERARRDGFRADIHPERFLPEGVLKALGVTRPPPIREATTRGGGGHRDAGVFGFREARDGGVSDEVSEDARRWLGNALAGVFHERVFPAEKHSPSPDARPATRSSSSDDPDGNRRKASSGTDSRSALETALAETAAALRLREEEVAQLRAELGTLAKKHGRGGDEGDSSRG